MRRLLAMLLVGGLCAAPSSLLAHPGGMDAYGCHQDSQQGGYHCHRGPLAGERFTSQEEMLEQLRALEQAAPTPETLSARALAASLRPLFLSTNLLLTGTLNRAIPREPALAVLDQIEERLRQLRRLVLSLEVRLKTVQDEVFRDLKEAIARLQGMVRALQDYLRREGTERAVQEYRQAQAGALASITRLETEFNLRVPDHPELRVEGPSRGR